jgi:hypothetical protein
MKITFEIVSFTIFNRESLPDVVTQSANKNGKVCSGQIFKFVKSVGPGLYYKHMTIVNDDSRLVIKRSFKLIDAARSVIHDRHIFIVQAIGL